MFLDNLSVSLLQICDAERLSYERASERCKCSSKHFSNIVRKRSYPSLNVLEKICVGFRETPNHLLGVKKDDESSFRTPMPVVKIHTFPLMSGSPSFPVCPQCGQALDREYLAYCNCCGQCLFWEFLKDATIVKRP